MLPVALTIAGSDPSGGAGIQADLKTFHRFGVYGEAVITLLTVQNTRNVTRVDVMDERLVLEQLDSVIFDILPHAAKTGALGNVGVVRAVAERAGSWRFPLVVDPVMVSKHGALLIEDAAVEALRMKLLPRAYLITPNLPEAAVLTGREVRTLGDMRDAARALCDMGAHAALVKGGHLEGSSSADILFADGAFHEFNAPRVVTRHTHGTGCTYSAGITAGLARGASLLTAVEEAKAFVTRAIESAPGLGGGSGPLNHWA